MPSGYTSIIYDNHNVSLSDFLWHFVNVHTKDCDIDSLIKEEKKYLSKYRRSLTIFQKLKNLQIQKRIDKEFINSEKIGEKFRIERIKLKLSYERLIKEVENWNCPNSEFKHLILRQLKESLDFDCPDSLIIKKEKEKPCISEYKKNTYDLLKFSIFRHEENIRKLELTRKTFADIKRAIPVQDKAFK